MMAETTSYTNPIIVTDDNAPIEPKPASSFDEEEQEEDEKEDWTSGVVKPWDEGGASDCGYAELVHSTLMQFGGSIHSCVGDPSNETRQFQTTIGNWFQELSYAARDLLRGGENSEEMRKDAEEAVAELINGGHDALKATGSTLSNGLNTSNSFVMPHQGTATA